ncbi:putative leucine-rich repeat-containing protein [Schistosoma mansoni]|uniref:putative leucine-rich repeat-containing protein n=1 Tax=Schistosoma mansoni TaxID=6183 RepID=UPI0001A6389C|nr:putative leucine-rich repeat-containing protein [Schistosoma mansoni]|eukprot:XP_018654938.1 putative leucine-rich repeat-containing protein [Schistosoma mansoni]
MANVSLRLYIETDDTDYPGLKRLKLQGKDLENVPAELFMLRELQVLDMSPERQPSLTYKLLELPSDIGYLINLRILILDTNELHSLPSEIGSLTQLEKLSASNNQLKNLSSNHLEMLPSSITDLINLESLLLFDNRLISLPEDIGELRNIRCLWLGDNKLESLPQSIVELRGLIWSPLLSPSTTVGGNPLRDPPIKVCSAGLEELDRYFGVEIIK